ncbi:hypothetical protein A7J57_12190 [Agrobacterium tumefaciens]|uniref:Uncharacterized protein n=1 Tax=Agrobacterium tumefaciens TaxID=358 RepID=A0A176XC44_AGRTU|nr:hypothetical protein A7J57_12190 [Agrobacterium tumefaciens]
MGQARDPEKWDDADTKQLIDLAVEGRDIREISKIMGRTRVSLAPKPVGFACTLRGARPAGDFDPTEQSARRCMPCQGWMAGTHSVQRICKESKLTYVYCSA